MKVCNFHEVVQQTYFLEVDIFAPFREFTKWSTKPLSRSGLTNRGGTINDLRCLSWPYLQGYEKHLLLSMVPLASEKKRKRIWWQFDALYTRTLVVRTLRYQRFAYRYRQADTRRIRADRPRGRLDVVRLWRDFASWRQGQVRLQHLTGYKALEKIIKWFESYWSSLNLWSQYFRDSFEHFQPTVSHVHNTSR